MRQRANTLGDANMDEADTPPQTRKTRRAGRRGAPQRDRKLQTKDKQLKELLMNMGKLLLSTTQQVRTLRGATLDTFIADSDHQAIKAVEAEGKAFAQQVEQWRKRREDDEEAAPPGPPAPTVFVELVTTLAAMDVGAATRQTLQGMLDSVERHASPQTFLAQQIQVCRLESIKQEGKAKLVMNLNRVDPSIRTAIIGALTQTGADHKAGAAPPGYLEDEVSAWVTAIGDSMQ